MIILKNLQQIDLKLLQNDSFKKTAEATGDLTGNKIANKITKLSKNEQQNSSEKVRNKYHKEISEEKYISPEKRQKIIEELRLK